MSTPICRVSITECLGDDRRRWNAFSCWFRSTINAGICLARLRSLLPDNDLSQGVTRLISEGCGKKCRNPGVEHPCVARCRSLATVVTLDKATRKKLEFPQLLGIVAGYRGYFVSINWILVGNDCVWIL